MAGRGQVSCDQVREAVSALLDDQDPGLRQAEVDEHLAGCGDCRRWRHDAARVTRLARLAPVGDGVDVSAAVLDRVPLARRSRSRGLLRLVLLAVALTQLALGITGLTPAVLGRGATAQGIPMLGADGHLGHELAAFNVAIAVALLWIVFRPARARGPLPLLAAFVLVLAAMSVADLVAGRVGWDRLAIHLPTVAGLVLAVLLARVEPPDGHPVDGAAVTAPEQTGPAAETGDGGLGPQAGSRGSAPPAAYRESA
ncbi:MAG: hypothetical protein GEV09_10500 [Pseudonocardiaceae bacterium]|nr:hypothetical protein [Pseudonocardiaceae bacterium]